ncbi:MAG: hypothetical protein ABUS79_00195 [Pseudomonadota bacterium]
MNRLSTHPAKISAPRSTQVVVRSRLHRSLDDAGKRPGTWVIGAAGAGKTALVASYLARTRVPCLRQRRAVGGARVLRLSQGRLSLDRQRCWADVWELEAVLRRLRARLEAPQAVGASAKLGHLADRLCTLYQGPLLGGRAPDGPTESRRRRLHRSVLQAWEDLLAHWKRTRAGRRSRTLDRLRALGDDDRASSAAPHGTT